MNEFHEDTSDGTSVRTSETQQSIIKFGENREMTVVDSGLRLQIEFRFLGIDLQNRGDRA